MDKHYYSFSNEYTQDNKIDDYIAIYHTTAKGKAYSLDSIRDFGNLYNYYLTWKEYKCRAYLEMSFTLEKNNTNLEGQKPNKDKWDILYNFVYGNLSCRQYEWGAIYCWENDSSSISDKYRD